MTGSPPNCLSRMILAVPVPLQIEEIKTQPSLERVKLNELLGPEIADSSSSSETKLFSFFSPEKRVPASRAPATPQMKMSNEAIRLTDITRRYLECQE